MIRPTAAAAHGTFGRHLHMLISVMFYCLLIKPKQFVYHFNLPDWTFFFPERSIVHDTLL